MDITRFSLVLIKTVLINVNTGLMRLDVFTCCSVQTQTLMVLLSRFLQTIHRSGAAMSSSEKLWRGRNNRAVETVF